MLAAATAEPGGVGPQLAVRTGSAVPYGTADAATLVLGTEYARTLAEAAPAGPAWLVTAGAWKLAIASSAAISAGLAAGLPCLNEAGPVTVAVWLAAALACGEVFKHVGRIRDGKGRLIEAFSVNLWTLSGSDGFAELAGPDGPATRRAARPLRGRRRRGGGGIPVGARVFRRHHGRRAARR